MVLPFLCILATFHPSRQYPFLRSVVAGIALYETLIFVLPLTLGNVGILTTSYYRTGFATASCIILLIALTRLTSVGRAISQIRYKPNWRDIPTILCLGTAIQLVHNEWYNDWTWGTPSYDGMHYHIPRAFMWIWHNDFRPYSTVIWQHLGQPYGGAATLLPSVFNGCGWIGGAYPALMISIGTASAAALIARSFGLGLRASLLGGLVLLSCPPVGLRMVDINTDVAAAFAAIAAFALARTTSSLPWALFFFIALTGLGASIKQYVAFPAIAFALFLFVPSTFKILKSPKALLGAIAGGIVALGFMFLSLYPVYTHHGDLQGGAYANSLSNLHGSWADVKENLVTTSLQWSFEILEMLPEETRIQLFHTLGIEKVYDYFKVPGGRLNIPYLDRERSRAALYSLLFFPWLILAVNKRWRIWATLGFVVVFCAQFAPLKLNHVGARFAIVPLAAYSILWAARAQKSPVIVALLALIVLTKDVAYANRGTVLKELWPTFTPAEVNKDMAASVGSQTLYVLSRHMSLDAEIIGRFGQLRIDYVSCPPDGNWVGVFSALREKTHWFTFLPREGQFPTGPEFQILSTPQCPATNSQELRTALTAAGWRLDKVSTREYELWTHD